MVVGPPTVPRVLVDAVAPGRHATLQLLQGDGPDGELGRCPWPLRGKASIGHLIRLLRQGQRRDVLLVIVQPLLESFALQNGIILARHACVDGLDFPPIQHITDLGHGENIRVEILVSWHLALLQNAEAFLAGHHVGAQRVVGQSVHQIDLLAPVVE